jgi:hypothetical protein
MQPSDQHLFSPPTQIPVCVGDLTSHQFVISSDQTMEFVLKEMEERPELPGVVIMGKQISVISRLKMFERLGHQYGVELFLHKPISKLEKALQAKAFLVPNQTRIEEAVQMALSRPQSDIYDPLVTVDEKQVLRLVDMHVLLLAQSRILSNIGNTVGKLEQLDKLISSGLSSEEMLPGILELLSHLVPYHQASIFVQQGKGLRLVAKRGLDLDNKNINSNQILESLTYQMMSQTRQAVSLADVSTVRDWEYFACLGTIRSWMGIPLIGDPNLAGLISLGRMTHSPFNRTERDTAQVFASRIVHSFEKQKANLIRKELEKAVQANPLPQSILCY